MGKPVTLARIAREAGVSAPTVSRVVNGHSVVAPETRARVERVLQKYGYRRRVRRDYDLTAMVGLVFAGIEQPWTLDVIRGAEHAAHTAGAGITMSVLRGHRERERAWLKQVATHGISGLVVVQADPAASAPITVYTRSLPVVVIDPNADPTPEIPSVHADERGGALAATRHLVALGHRRIAVVGHMPALPSTRARIEGHRMALESSGFTMAPELVRNGASSICSFREQIHDLLTLDDPPTAVIASNDFQAVAVMQAARERGLRVPEDLSVIGFDDIPLAEIAWPPLTTIRRPFEKMAALAVRMVLAISYGDPLQHQRVELDTQLVCRASTAPPSA